MFHFKDEDTQAPGNDVKKRIKKAFYGALSNPNDDVLLYKTDFKVAWLYLFGYKISKVKKAIKIKNFKILSNMILTLSMNCKNILKNLVKIITRMDFLMSNLKKRR